MIEEINIHAFKSIKEMSISFSNLNLLVGMNSSGKSSIIQTILMLEQQKNSGIALNGELIQMGEFNEVHNYYNDEKVIKIAFKSGVSEVKLNLSKDSSQLQKKNETNKLWNNLHYLACYRVGAQDILITFSSL